MRLMITFITQLAPLYSLIIVGYVAGRKLKIQKESMASLVMYIITPPVIFLGVYKAPHTHEYALLPFIFALISSLIAICSYWIAKKRFTGITPNLLSFLAGSTNVGYFGLPALMTVVGPKAFPVLAQFVVGMALFQTTVGVFILLRGKMSVIDGLKKTLTLPILHGFLLGLLFKYAQIPLSASLENFLEHFKGAYSITGMMMIGLTLKKIKWTKDNSAFIAYTLFFKFLVWPLTLYGFIWLDRHLFHLYDPFTQSIFLMLAFVPIAANTMSYTVELKVINEEITFAVILSTIIGFFLFPLMLPSIL